MSDINVGAVVVSALVVQVISTVYYLSLNEQLKKLSEAYKTNRKTPEPWKPAVELVRNLVLTVGLAYLFTRIAVANMSGALGIGLLLWVSFPVVLLTGSIMWEKVAPKLAAIHAGDWLMKLLVISAIVQAWQ